MPSSDFRVPSRSAASWRRKATPAERFVELRRQLQTDLALPGKAAIFLTDLAAKFQGAAVDRARRLVGALLETHRVEQPIERAPTDVEENGRQKCAVAQVHAQQHHGHPPAHEAYFVPGAGGGG